MLAPEFPNRDDVGFEPVFGKVVVALLPPNEGALDLLAEFDPKMFCEPKVWTGALLVPLMPPKILEMPGDTEVVEDTPPNIAETCEELFDAAAELPPKGVAIDDCVVFCWKEPKVEFAVPPAPNKAGAALWELELLLLPPKVKVPLVFDAVVDWPPNLNILVAELWLDEEEAPVNIECPPKGADAPAAGCALAAAGNPAPNIGAITAVGAALVAAGFEGAPKRFETVPSVAGAMLLEGVDENEKFDWKGVAVADVTDPEPNIDAVETVDATEVLTPWLNKFVPEAAVPGNVKDPVVDFVNWPNIFDPDEGCKLAGALLPKSELPVKLLADGPVEALACVDGVNEKFPDFWASAFGPVGFANVPKLIVFTALLLVDGLNLKFAMGPADDTFGATELATAGLENAKEAGLTDAAVVEFVEGLDWSVLGAPNLNVDKPDPVSDEADVLNCGVKEKEGIDGAADDMFEDCCVLSVSFAPKLKLGTALVFGGTTDELKLMLPKSEDEVVTDFAGSEAADTGWFEKFIEGLFAVSLTVPFVFGASGKLSAGLGSATAEQPPSFDIPKAVFWINGADVKLGTPVAILPVTDDIIVWLLWVFWIPVIVVALFEFEAELAKTAANETVEEIGASSAVLFSVVWAGLNEEVDPSKLLFTLVTKTLIKVRNLYTSYWYAVTNPMNKTSNLPAVISSSNPINLRTRSFSNSWSRSKSFLLNCLTWNNTIK